MAARVPGAEAEHAMDELCQRYWPALQRFAVRMGCSPQDADDMAQGFFLKIIEKDLFNRADPLRGKFRTFLITAFRRHMQDVWSGANAAKRGGEVDMVSFEAAPEEGVSSDDAAFDREWARRVMELSLERLQSRYEEEGQSQAFEVLNPHLTGDLPEGGIAELAARLQVKDGAAKVALHRIRKRFAEELRQEVAETLGEGDAVDDELRYLMSAIA